MVSKIEIKLLLHDLKSLNSELINKKKKLDYINIYFRDKIQDINNTTEDIIVEQKQNFSENINNENTIEEVKSVKNIDIINDNNKKIYREIVLLTHTDKLDNNDNKNEYLNLYRNATDNKNNISQLLIIADELNINIENYLNDDNIVNVKDNINIIKSQLLHIEQMQVWKWYHTENEKVKEILLKNFKQKYN